MLKPFFSLLFCSTYLNIALLRTDPRTRKQKITHVCHGDVTCMCTSVSALWLRWHMCSATFQVSCWFILGYLCLTPKALQWNLSKFVILRHSGLEILHLEPFFFAFFSTICMLKSLFVKIFQQNTIVFCISEMASYLQSVAILALYPSYRPFR